MGKRMGKCQNASLYARQFRMRYFYFFSCSYPGYGACHDLCNNTTPLTLFQRLIFVLFFVYQTNVFIITG